MVAGIGGGNCYGIRLVPTSGRAPKAPQPGLTGVRRKAAAIDSEQLHEAADIRSLLERERAIHIGFAGAQLGVEEQLGVEPGIMQANGHGRSRTVTAKGVQRTVSSDQTQHTVSDEAVEEVSKQPHRQ